MSKTTKPKKSKKRKCDIDDNEIVLKKSKSKKPSKKLLLDKQSKTLSPVSKGMKEKSQGKAKLKSMDDIESFKDSSDGSNYSVEHRQLNHLNAPGEDITPTNFVEPNTKEKLRYLRYFRLVTHRKRNGKKQQALSTKNYHLPFFLCVCIPII